MQYCPNCGKEIPDNIEFCPYCGARISQKEMLSTLPPTRHLHKEESQSVSRPVRKEKKVNASIGPIDTAEEPAEEVKREPEGQFRAKTLYCPNCGEKLEEGIEYCPKCGAKVSSPQEDEADILTHETKSKSTLDYGASGERNRHTLANQLLILSPIFLGLLTFSAFFVWEAMSDKKKCDLGIASGCDSLGFSYIIGYGGEQNYTKGIKYYKKACNLGYGEGCDHLGDLYEEGRGVERSDAKAKEYYEKACELDHDGGCFSLGSSYLYGDGVERSDAKAKVYYQKACSLGRDYACEYAKEIDVK